METIRCNNCGRYVGNSNCSSAGSVADGLRGCLVCEPCQEKAIEGEFEKWQKNEQQLTPPPSDCGSVANPACITPRTDGARSAEKPPRIVVVLPNVEIPSLNRLNRSHWGKYSQLKRGYSRILREFALPLFAAVVQSRSTMIICMAVQSLSGTQSRRNLSDATMPSDTESSGSTGRKKARQRGSRFRK